ncbi:hypothetical protein TI05_13960 [Achromatium sp. WMS3]|nr:hypothetical protein TI05_13960 [Achromatium sp. WMS3]
MFLSVRTQAIISVNGKDILEVSRTLSNHKGTYQRNLKLLGPSDGSKELGKTSLYGGMALHGDSEHAEHGIGPNISFHSAFPDSKDNRHLYMSLGDTWNNRGVSKNDFVIYSWDNAYQNHIQHMIFKANGNIGIGDITDPGAKLHVNGNFIRTIAYATGNGPNDGTDVGQIKSRVLRFTKAKAATKLRISYTDNFSTHGKRLSSCRWEIRVDGNSCPNQKLIYDDISATGDYTHTDHTVVGYCSGIKAGSHTIEVWVNSSATPNPGSGNCQTGWNNSTWVLEAEEVN